MKIEFACPDAQDGVLRLLKGWFISVTDDKGFTYTAKLFGVLDDGSINIDPFHEPSGTYLPIKNVIPVKIVVI